MKQRFQNGSRVRVDEESGWFGGPVGTIRTWRGAVGVLLTRLGENLDEQQLARVVNTVDGPELSYWIRFDSPQLDAEGDGPYESAEVLDRYLQSV